jgi:hypothetical protein
VSQERCRQLRLREAQGPSFADTALLSRHCDG